MGKKKKGKVKVSAIPVSDKADDIVRVEPDEWYKVEFLEATLGEGSYGPYIIMNFKLRSGHFENSEKSAKGWKVNRLVNAKIHEDSDLYKNFVKIMMGKKPLKKGKKIDLTAYYGNRYLGLVRDRKQKKGETGPVRQHLEKIKLLKKKK